MRGSDGWMRPRPLRRRSSWTGGRGVRGVWGRLVGGGTDLVGEEMFALEIRNLRLAIGRRNADPEAHGTFVIPEEFVWPA